MIDTPKLILMSVPVLRGFRLIEPRDWEFEGTFLELMTEIGSLGRNLTIWENYRYGRKSRHNMADELSDIFFVLVKLMRYLNITIGILDSRSIESPEKAFFRMMQLATGLQQKIMGVSADMATVQRDIEEMISIVGGFAEYYRISLEEAHLEEMRFASLWQRMFFAPDGKKITRLVFLRKLVWKFTAWRHLMRMDRWDTNSKAKRSRLV